MVWLRCRRSRLGVDDDVGDPRHGAPHTLLDRARLGVRLREGRLAADGQREEGNDPLVRSDETELPWRRARLVAYRALDRRLVNRDLFARRHLLERLEMRPHVPDLRKCGEDRSFDVLRDPVGLLEAQVTGELEMERDLETATDLEHDEIVNLAYLGNAECGSQRPLPQLDLVRPRLDVDDDVRIG